MDLKLCPFCGASLERDEYGAQHPGDDCVLSQVYIFDTNLHEWNVRADTSALAAAAMRDAAEKRLRELKDNTLMTLDQDAAIQAAADRIARLPLPGDPLAAALRLDKIKAVVEALRRSREGWGNAIELDLIPERHRTTAEILRDEAHAALSALEGKQ